jgi:hypothetical protein
MIAHGPVAIKQDSSICYLSCPVGWKDCDLLFSRIQSDYLMWIRPHGSRVPALVVGPKNDLTNDRSKSALEEKFFAVIPLVQLFTISLL